MVGLWRVLRPKYYTFLLVCVCVEGIVSFCSVRAGELSAHLVVTRHAVGTSEPFVFVQMLL